MKAIRINKNDNVAVALEPLEKGEKIIISDRELFLSDEIPQGHKFTISKLERGEDIIKYGYPIGTLQEDVKEGTWIHTHNLKTKLAGLQEYQYNPDLKASTGEADKRFWGYLRPNGKVGVRNEIWIIPAVGCVNHVARRLAADMNCNPVKGVDGFYAFEHPYGCSQMSEDQENTKKILAGLIEHPNAAAVLVLGLGCENCSADSIKEILGRYDKNHIEFMICQETTDEISSGKSLLKKLAKFAQQFERKEISLSELIIGLKCGGSDGLSGITANPLVGSFSDHFIAMGGSTVLTEVPEMFGAETLLMNRCEHRDTFDKLVSLINEYKDYYLKHNQAIYENPSPGNKEGGISTLEDKSLGCIQKGGSSNACDVLEYAGRVNQERSYDLILSRQRLGCIDGACRIRSAYDTVYNGQGDTLRQSRYRRLKYQRTAVFLKTSQTGSILMRECLPMERKWKP